jgi:hypothetical protein
MPDSNAGEAYSQLISDQLAEERDRKTTLEARGITVISTSGALATLMLGLTVGVTAATTFRFPGPVKIPLVLALAMFVLAAACGLTANVPMHYKEPTVGALAGLVDVAYWTGPRQTGSLRVAEAQVKVLEASRVANAMKARLILAAISFELMAIAFLAWAAAGIIYSI